MQKLFLFLLFSVSTIFTLQAQSIGNTELKNADHFVWFGLDFSHLQLVGRSGFPDEEEVAKNKVHQWNDLIIKENEKYDISGFFNKSKFHYDLAAATRQNEKLSPDGLVVKETKDLNLDQIKSIISNYSSEEYNEGLGLVFIVEKFDSPAEKAALHVTFFDIQSKEIVQVVKYSSNPFGFGMRNYWAGAIHSIMNKLEDDYKKWLKKNK